MNICPQFHEKQHHKRELTQISNIHWEKIYTWSAFQIWVWVKRLAIYLNLNKQRVLIKFDISFSYVSSVKICKNEESWLILQKVMTLKTSQKWVMTFTVKSHDPDELTWRWTLKISTWKISSYLLLTCYVWQSQFHHSVLHSER